MKILYIGDTSPGTSSRHRSEALRRLGHEVIHINPPKQWFEWELRHPLFGRFHYWTGFRFLQGKMRSRLGKELPCNGKDYHVAWVDSGEWFGSEAVRSLKRVAQRTILYNLDDPTGSRDGGRWLSLRSAISEYDLCAVVRRESKEEFLQCGARQMIHVWRSYDEQAHRPFSTVHDIPPNFRSDVAFIGTWMRGEGRDTLVARLLEFGVPLSIWGDRWQKSLIWKQIKSAWRGPAIGGRDYVAAIQGAKLCLGMLSKGNRDLHTQRSAEIPYAGGLLCAERTSEHLAMYREGEEAVFWRDAEECARICHDLLNDDEKRERIRQAGRRRVLDLKIGNEDICRQIIHEIEALEVE